MGDLIVVASHVVNPGPSKAKPHLVVVGSNSKCRRVLCWPDESQKRQAKAR